jgi:hypothetical protein
MLPRRLSSLFSIMCICVQPPEKKLKTEGTPAASTASVSMQPASAQPASVVVLDSKQHSADCKYDLVTWL